MRLPTIFALALVLAAGACHSWRPQTSPAPDAVGAMNGRGTVRVFRHDGSVTVLAGPRVEGDSIVGSAGSPPRHAAVAVADVERIDQRKVSAGKTLGLVAGTYGVAALVVAFAALAGAFSRFGDC